MTVGYCGMPPVPAEIAQRWNADPALLAGLALAFWLAGRAPRRGPARAGVAVLALAFATPLCALGTALFAARTVHHLLLVGVAAPLLARAMPRGRTPGPAPAFCIATAILWVWHLPAPYAAALADTPLYWLMQATLLGSAMLFWRALFAAPPVPAAMAGVAAMTQMGMLGALLTFARAPLYAPHFATTAAWGLGPVADQQLAGLLMWVVGTVPYAAATALALARHWRRGLAAA